MKNQKELIFVIPYNSVDEIPMEEYKHLHKAYWEFIAEHHLPLKPKIQFADGPLSTILCFACQYSMRNFPRSHIINSNCYHCPLTCFRESNTKCFDHGSIYDRWGLSSIAKDKLAMEIANLEWEDSHDDI